MSRRTMADRKRRAADRKTRRESLFVTLARLDRGVITNAERPLLREAVEAEIIESDDLRSTIDGLQRALQAALRRAEAAEEAIVEAEQDRDEQRDNYIRACNTIAAMHAAAMGEVRGPIRGVVEDVADMRAERDEAAQLSHQYRNTVDRARKTCAAITAEWHGQYRAEGSDVHATVARIEQALDGDQPADVRGPVELHLVGEWHDVTEHMRPAASVGIAHPLARAAAAEAELTRSENARDALRKRLADAEQAARTAIENHQEAERQLATLREKYDQLTRRNSVLNAELDRRSVYQPAGEDRQRAERAEAELAAARTHAAEQGKTIARLLREVGDAEQQAADMRKAYTEADALATLRTHQRDEARALMRAARETLRATEDQLADARRRLRIVGDPAGRQS